MKTESQEEIARRAKIAMERAMDKAEKEWALHCKQIEEHELKHGTPVLTKIQRDK